MAWAIPVGIIQCKDIFREAESGRGAISHIKLHRTIRVYSSLCFPVGKAWPEEVWAGFSSAQ
jgi:hypothetical protein